MDGDCSVIRNVFVVFILVISTVNCNALVQVGIAVEDTEDILTLSKVRNLVKNHKIFDSHVNISLAISKYIDPFNLLQRSCGILRSSPIFFTSISSAMTSFTIQSMLNSMQIPNIYFPRLSNVPLNQPNFPKFSYSIPFIPVENNVFEKIVSIANKLSWSDLVIYFDGSYDHTTMKHFKNYLVSSSGKNKIVVHLREVFDSMNGRNILVKTLQGNPISKNIILMVNEENTESILAQGRFSGITGPDYKWILANANINVCRFLQMDNSTNLLAIVHQVGNELKFNDANELVSGCNFNRTSVHLSHLHDSLLILQDILQKIDVESIKRHSCECFQSAKYFQDGAEILTRLKKLAPLRGLTGIISYSNHVLSAFSPNVFPLENMPSHPAFKNNRYLSVLRNVMGYNTTTTKMIRTSSWQGSENGWIQHNDDFPMQYENLKGLKLRIVTIVEEPFIIAEKSPSGAHKEFKGYCIDILKAIKRVATEKGSPFDYEIYEVSDNEYGVQLDNQSKWTGLVGDIVSGKADMAVAGMIRNYARQNVVDFTASYMDYGVGILIRKPQKTTSIFGFLEPLRVQVWICISVATFGIGVVMFILARISPYAIHNRDGSPDFSFQNSMWFALSSLMQQGSDVTPKSVSGRMMGTFWWFFTLIVIATYTANLAAFLTVTRMESPVESLQDLASQSKISYGTVGKSSLLQFIKDQSNGDAELYKSLWRHMANTKPSPIVRDVKDGYERVLKGGYAFLWDYPVLQYQMKRRCQFTIVGKQFNRKNYAFAVPKNAPYKESITLSILSLQESGELEKMRQVWFETDSLCADEDSSDDREGASGLKMTNLAGVFYILIMGAGLSFFSALIEFIWYNFLRSTYGCEKDRERRKRSIPDSIPFV